MKMKLFDGAAQTTAELTLRCMLALVIRSSNSVPDPESGVMSFE